MQKLRFFLLLLFVPGFLFAQQRTKIILQRSTVANVNTKTDITHVKNPVFIHDNAILTCDSANFYPKLNFFEAFNNVHINQGDTLNIYSDFLNYNGNTKDAHLTGKVRLEDRTPTILTTNLLDYNTGTRIGKYYEGGKIVNKDVTLTSKKGWYFANDKDAFFRYNVVVVTPQTTIKSDTLRYNTATNWTYFYGPTNIKGKDDNLYTENGAYNTTSENAYFGKKNLYTQDSKSLKGDSLYYNGKTGYGRAVKNIIFMDISDKLLLRGQLGEYYKSDERVVVTKNAWFAMGTKDSVVVKEKKMPDSLFLGADTLESQKVFQKTLKLISKPIIQKDNEVGAEDEAQKKLKSEEKAAARKELSEANNKQKTEAATSTPNKKLSKKERKAAEEKAKDLKNNPPPAQPDSVKTALPKTQTDSLKADSVKKPVVNASLQKLLAKGDTVKANKGKLVKAADPKVKSNARVTTKKDTATVFNPADTVQTRIIKAFHNVRVFKSNMQAKADSLFYTAADSTLRWYKNPMLWSEGSQQTGDTIHVFFKNDKMHSFQVLQNGFIVNVETDSTKFNQVKGKLITGFFNKEGSLTNMYVDGNAESMYYNKDNKGNYDNLSQTVSSRIKFNFANKELTDVITIRGNEGAVYPIDSLPKNTILTGFIWKPELRPLSKADIIKGKPAVKTTKAVVKPGAKTPAAKSAKGNLAPSSKTNTSVSKGIKKENTLPPLKPKPEQVKPADSAKKTQSYRVIIKN